MGAQRAARDNRQYLRDLPLAWQGELAGKAVYMCHGKPGNNMWGMYKDHLSKTYLKMVLRSLGVDILVTGHTHLPLFVKNGLGLPGQSGFALYLQVRGARPSHTYGVLSLPDLSFRVYDASARGGERPIDIILAAAGRRRSGGLKGGENAAHRQFALARLWRLDRRLELYLGGLHALFDDCGLAARRQGPMRLGWLVMMPFGKRLTPAPGASGCFAGLISVLWLVVAGWSIALTHLLFALMLAPTLIGIPIAVQHLRLLPVALFPDRLSARAGAEALAADVSDSRAEPDTTAATGTRRERRPIMRVLMLSKACVVGIYQPKLEAIARLGVELRVLTPPSWRDERGEQKLERRYTAGYELQAIPIRFNGSFHLHHYPTLARELRSFKPDIAHIDEEPYNLATWQALRLARLAGAKALFFSWQNICRRYPPPFSWGESWVLRRSDYALAGTAEARGCPCAQKGYAGPLAAIPQFGTSEELFRPAESRSERPFTIGYIGRLVPEKGVSMLLRAAAHLGGEWRLRIVGGGPAKADLTALAQRLSIGRNAFAFIGQLPSDQLPAEYHELDALVLPSLDADPNWKEQFGRVLVEAMASGVPVIGSDSGAIPGVVGGAGLIVPEGDCAALTAALRDLRDSPAARAEQAKRGRGALPVDFHARARGGGHGGGVSRADGGLTRAQLPLERADHEANQEVRHEHGQRQLYRHRHAQTPAPAADFAKCAPLSVAAFAAFRAASR